MNDIERRISAFFREEAHRASPSNEMYQRVLRRAKLRRMVTATVAGVAAVSILMAGIVTAGALRSPDRSPPVGPARSPSPGDQQIGPERVVGQGTVSDQTWRLLAYASATGLCVDAELGKGSVGGCGFDVPDKRDLGFSVGSLRGLSRTIILGVLSTRVAALTVRLDSGEQIDVNIIQSSDDFDVNFFVAFLPPDAKGSVVASDDKGALLQKERLRSLSDQRDQKVFTEEVLDDHKLVVYYPTGWNRAPDALISGVDQRTELLSLGTYALTPGRQDCDDIPEQAIEGLGPTDAFITLQESSSGGGFPARPKDFSLADGEIPEQIECLDNAEDIFFRVFPFRDERRNFFAYVAFGNSVSTQTRNELWQILNSLDFCDPASPPGDCL